MADVQQYQEAFRQNMAAREAVKAKVKLVHDVSSAINYHLRSFLGFNFNIRIDNRHERFDPKGRIDIGTWPSADELRALFVAWNEADSHLRQVWEGIPAKDRAGLSAPPSEMSL